MSCPRVFGAVWIFVVLFIPVSSVVASDVVLNEFQVDPSTLQWVELYNIGSSPLDISQWVIDDNGSPTTKYTISDNTILPPHTCMVFSSGNFNFNTSFADSARLLSGETIVDSYAYQKNPGSGISFLRLPDGVGEWATASANFGSFNSGGDPCLPPATPTPSPTPSSTPTPTNNPTNTPFPMATAGVSPTATPKPTNTGSLSPTKRIAFDILGTSQAASYEAVRGDTVATDSGKSAVSSGRARPFVFALLFIGVGLALLSFALAIRKTDVWKKLQESSSSTGLR